MESKIKVYGHRRQLVNYSFACIPFSRACLERLSVRPPSSLQFAVSPAPALRFTGVTAHFLGHRCTSDVDKRDVFRYIFV